MIAQAAAQALEEGGLEPNALVTVSIPGGEKLAARTFNSRLGIVGGLAVLGTSGIVEPRSDQAPVSYTRLTRPTPGTRPSGRVCRRSWPSSFAI